MRKVLAYSKDLAARRRNSERVGLLVVALHDWDAGKWFEGRPEVARVLLPDDVPVADADWSVCLALDVLLCGSAPDDVFYAACSALERAGAASIWGDFSTGVSLVERCGKTWVAVDGPFSIEKLGAALRQHRSAAILLRLGVYSSRLYDGARQAMLAPFLGALVES
jgi:hypothetical protein